MWATYRYAERKKEQAMGERNVPKQTHRRAVVSIERHEDHRKSWKATLACGHVIWLSRRLRPTSRTLLCPACLWEQQQASRQM
jgi:hypothetical protein